MDQIEPTADQPGTPAPIPDIPEIVERYVNGDSAQLIALDCGVTARTIYRWMFSEVGDKYHDLVTNALINRVADADTELRAARDSGDACRIACAREAARFARMDLERRRPALYGQRHQHEITHSVDLGDRLRRARDRTIDVAPAQNCIENANAHGHSDSAVIQGDAQRIDS